MPWGYFVSFLQGLSLGEDDIWKINPTRDVMLRRAFPTESEAPSTPEVLGVQPHPLGLKWFPAYTGFTVWLNGSQHPHYTSCYSALGLHYNVWLAGHLYWCFENLAHKIYHERESVRESPYMMLWIQNCYQLIIAAALPHSFLFQKEDEDDD